MLLDYVSSQNNKSGLHISTLLFFALLIFSTQNTFASGGGGGGGGFETGKANYFDIDTPFVVNITDGPRKLRFLQVAVNLMTKDSNVVDAVNKHIAPIKHELVMLFSQQKFGTVTSRNAREQLRKDALTRVQLILEKYAGITPDKTVKGDDGEQHPSSVQDLFFTNFIIQ